MNYPGKVLVSMALAFATVFSVLVFQSVSERDRPASVRPGLEIAEKRENVPNHEFAELDPANIPQNHRAAQEPTRVEGEGRDAPGHEAPGVPPQQHDTIADILEEIGDLSDPQARAEAVEAIRGLETARLESARERARELGLPLRVERPDGSVKEIYNFENDAPLYRITHNVNAAISTATDVIRDNPDETLDGEGVTIGMWDGGTARASHQEFGSRMNLIDSTSAITHATHVGGTLIAAGVDSRALGMAPLARVDSYDWNDDKEDMVARWAAAPNESGKIYISNHSYGFVAGWLRQGGSSPSYTWYGSGSGSDAIETRFGAYSTPARESDAIAHSAPYYLMVRSAGNERVDNPADGQNVALSPGGTIVSYDSSSHPPGDGVYRDGYDTISFDAVAKNVLTVGAVNDAVSGGLRDLSGATMSNFSSWGPTDDGRIKPDIVANGVTLVSAAAGSNSSYATLSGTSMSAPNATGSAALLIDLYSRLFPDEAMRASTLKGLLIHTADDLGNLGPDYRFGWGLLNAEAAAEVIREFAESPETRRMTEDTITAGDPVHVHEFVWDGESPIRATLSWTDPAGSATTRHDSRSSRLRNNLNLRIEAPDGEESFPYVMPFVGTWTQASMSEPAVTGVNNTDNINQVFIAEPSEPGVYRAIISFDGTLANDRQVYSLLLTGSAAEEPPPPALDIASVSPSSGLSGESVTLEVQGSGFTEDTSLRLSRTGQADIEGGDYEPLGAGARATFDLTGALGGAWDLVASRQDSETATLPGAFSVIAAIWNENFDGEVTGWQSEPENGSNEWVLTTDRSHTPPASYHAPGISERSIANLVSPEIAIPEDASDLQLRFWQRRAFPSNRHGGKLELSVNGGGWTDIADPDSGASFLSNGYNGTVSDIGPPPNRNLFEDDPAWTGNTSGFVETLVNLYDTEKFAGSTVRFRWRLGTNTRDSADGWWIDSIALLGDSESFGSPPVITSGPEATYTFIETEDETETLVIEGASTDLSVSAEAPDGDDDALIYTWSVNDSAEAPVAFSTNGTPGARNTTADFSSIGSYTFTVTVTDPEGLSTTGSVEVEVRAVADSISVGPSTATVPFEETLLFSATLLDQFSNPLAEQPSSFLWSVSGGGTIDTEGWFTANEVGDLFTVQASESNLSGFATITVTPLSAEIILEDLVQPFDGDPKTVSVATDPPDLAFEVFYDGSDEPPSAPGAYLVRAEVIEPGYVGDAEATLVIEDESDSEATSLDDLIEKYFPDADLETFDVTADHNGSGLPTLAEFAFGNDPATAGGSTFRSAAEKEAGTLTLIHPFDRAVEGIIIVQVEESADLGEWNVVVPGEDGVIREVEEEGFRAASGEGDEAVSAVDRVRISIPLSGDPSQFLRLRVRTAQ